MAERDAWSSPRDLEFFKDFVLDQFLARTGLLVCLP